MDQFDAGLAEVGEVVNVLRVAFADEDDERCLVDDAVLRQVMPVGRDRAALLQTLGVALDRENGDLRGRALQDLICDRLRPGERRDELHVLPVLLLPLRRERRIDRFLQRLLHDREAVDGDLHGVRAAPAADNSPTQAARDTRRARARVVARIRVCASRRFQPPTSHISYRWARVCVSSAVSVSGLELYSTGSASGGITFL